jgi:hypothetical protein
MSVEDTDAPDPPTEQQPARSITSEDIDEILGDKEPVDLKDIPF